MGRPFLLGVDADYRGMPAVAGCCGASPGWQEHPLLAATNTPCVDDCRAQGARAGWVRGRSCWMPMHRMLAMSGYVHRVDEGATYDWRGARGVIKASAEDTFGQLGVMESTYPPGLAVPSHHQADQA